MKIDNSFKFTPEMQKNRLMKSCEEFESFFHKMILKSGRSGSIESGLIEKSNAEKIFTDMYDTEISNLAAGQSTGGIKDILFNSLKGSLESLDGKNFPSQIERSYGSIDNKRDFKIINIKNNGIDIAQ